MKRVLIADDSTSVRSLLSAVLREHGHEPVSVGDGREALRLFSQEAFDLVVLDVMMPHVDGFEVCRRIREAGSSVPILFLSAKGDVIDRKTGLRVGADDYLPKPFDEEEFALRAEALMRRGAAASSVDAVGEIAIGRFLIDYRRSLVLKDGQDTRLTSREFQITALLATHYGETFSAESLADRIWDDEYFDAANSIPVYIRHIRSKIEDDPSHPEHLRTRRGCGYYFEP